MTDIALTPHQQAALDFVVQAIRDGAPLIALKGLAGTGKTSLIPPLRASLSAHQIRTVVSAPTNRAAMILRNKGLHDADTTHAHALMPHFTPDYTRALEWLGAEVAYRDGEEPHPDVDGLPYLVHTAVDPDLATGHNLQRQRYPAKRLLSSVGLHGKDFFAGFGPKKGTGVLLIDEASMVGASMLAMCQEAYPQIILIGDPGQLPPVKDTPVLPTAPGIDLTEIHRQAADSPIIQLAYQARQGHPFWRDQLRRLDDALQGDVWPCAQAAARDFLDAPLLVWRNVTRLECTHAIRQALGFAKDLLHVGEPLVCRSTSQDDRALGFYNNGLFRILEVDADDSRWITVEDALGSVTSLYAHLEEIDGEWIVPKAIPFRFGYCLTCHTAQGGEWPLVYISMPDLLKYAASSRRGGRKDELAQWAYTAITRAKNTLCFLTVHHFTAEKETPMAAPHDTIAPPSAPLLGTPPEPVRPEPDDIPEPVTPPAVVAAVTPTPAWLDHEALLQGFMQHFQSKVTAWLTDTGKDAMACVEDMHAYIKRQIELDHDKVTHAETALDKLITQALTQGLPLRSDPYELQVEAVSPHGYPLRVIVRKASAEELLTELPDVMDWLAAHQYEATAPVGG